MVAAFFKSFLRGLQLAWRGGRLGGMATRSYLPRFSLRLFIGGFTLAVLWLAWNAYIVEQRKAMLSEFRGKIITRRLAESSKTRDFRGKAGLAALGLNQVDRRIDGSAYYEATASADLPWIRRQMGDRAYSFIAVNESEQVTRVRKWFPEAICARKWILSSHH